MGCDLVCVKQTDFREKFEKVGKDTVFLLSRELSDRLWEQEINGKSRSYFDLPDDCWVISNTSNSIGNWIEAYNNDENAVVEALLRRSVDWPDDIVVRFFAKRAIVFQTRWSDFLRCWDEFIAVEEDCPIVVPEGASGKQALIFRPIGDIIKIG